MSEHPVYVRLREWRAGFTKNLRKWWWTMLLALVTWLPRGLLEDRFFGGLNGYFDRHSSQFVRAVVSFGPFFFYPLVTALLVVLGLVIHAYMSTRRAEPSGGPDLSLEWKHAKNSGDLIRVRNIGNASAFNIGLKFSWEELFFDPPFDKNVLHPNQEIFEPARFCERTGPNSVNLGWMDEILRVAFLAGRKPPLEVTLLFSDGRVRLEKPFTFELGPGGTNAERIRITPGPRKRIQAGS